MTDAPDTPTEPEREAAEREPLTLGDGPPPARFGETTWIDYWSDLAEKPDGTRTCDTYAYGMLIDQQSEAPNAQGVKAKWTDLMAAALPAIQLDADTYGIAP